MYLWILKPIKESRARAPTLSGVVVRAETNEKARQLASRVCGQEGRQVWLDKRLLVA